jgi:hypothetical protein
MVKKFLSKFDKKRLGIAFKITILVLGVVFIVNTLDLTYSRYQSSANMNIQSSIALFLVDQGTYTGSIALEGLEPSDGSYKYVVKVRNYKQSLRTNVDLDYHIKFETTTNLPITVSVYRNESNEAPGATNIVATPTYRTDGDVYYKVYDTNGTHRFHYNTNEEDYYTIVVTYSSSYKNYPELYQGKIDLLSVIVTAEQVV